MIAIAGSDRKDIQERHYKWDQFQEAKVNKKLIFSSIVRFFPFETEVMESKPHIAK